MSKYNNPIRLTEKNKDGFIFSSENGWKFRLDFLEKNILRVAQYRTDAKPLPTWFVCPGDEEMPLNGRERFSNKGFSGSESLVSEDAEGFDFSSELFDLRLDLLNFNLSCYTKEHDLLFADRPTQSYNFSGELGAKLCHYTTRKAEDLHFGLGDKTGNVDRTGQSFRFCCMDAMGYDAQYSDPLYKHIPFYICKTEHGSFGVFYDTAAECSLDFGRELDNYHGLYRKFETEEDLLCYYVFFGSMAEIAAAFSMLCGRQAFMPKRSLKYSGSTMTYTDAPDADHQLRGFIDKCRELNFDCGGFYLSSGYTSIGDKRFVFNWNYDKIPDPKDLAAFFTQNGVELIANIKPAFLLDHPMYKDLAEKGYFLKNPDGTPAVGQFWDGLGSYLDLTNPKAFDFWSAQVKEKLLDYGISATWNDNNEFEIWDREVMADNFGDPTPAYLIRPVLTALMVMASRKVQLESGLRPMTSTRSGGAGLWRNAQTWSGDNLTSWKTLRFNHKMGLSMSMSGMHHFGHDIGGFSGPRPEPELFMRWLQHGVFMPRFTIHSWNSDHTVNEPWMFEEFTPAIRNIFRLRHTLLPYIYSLLYQSHENAQPLIAPLFFYFSDEWIDVESDLFMLGPDLLAACIYDKGETWVKLRLPENNGGWYYGMQAYRGGDQVELNCGLSDPPIYFLRGGSVVPVNAGEYGFGSKDERIRFMLYPRDSGDFSAEYFNDDGISYKYRDGDCVQLHFEVSCDDNEVSVIYSNLGKQKMIPDIEMVDVQKRKLKISEKP